MTRTAVVAAVLLALGTGYCVGISARRGADNARTRAARPAQHDADFYGQVVKSDKILYVLDLGAGPVMLRPVHDTPAQPR